MLKRRHSTELHAQLNNTETEESKSKPDTVMLKPNVYNAGISCMQNLCLSYTSQAGGVPRLWNDLTALVGHCHAHIDVFRSIIASYTSLAWLAWHDSYTVIYIFCIWTRTWTWKIIYTFFGSESEIAIEAETEAEVETQIDSSTIHADLGSNQLRYEILNFWHAQRLQISRDT